MVQTGGKGSKVNHSQIAVLLGQQELEGQRVPRLPTCRTLPSFAMSAPTCACVLCRLLGAMNRALHPSLLASSGIYIVAL